MKRGTTARKSCSDASQPKPRTPLGTLALPDHPLLHEELLNTRWGLTDKEKIRVEVKKNIRARIGRSPDHADAVMMALAPANKCTGLAGMIDM